jgi:hypothetical protein
LWYVENPLGFKRLNLILCILTRMFVLIMVGAIIKNMTNGGNAICTKSKE